MEKLKEVIFEHALSLKKKLILSLGNRRVASGLVVFVAIFENEVTNIAEWISHYFGGA